MEQNPHIQPLVMNDREAGYVVSSFLFNQLEKAGLTLDEFLKGIVSGGIKFEVN